MADSTPAFVVVICFASGLLLIAAGIPMWLRRVPPNALVNTIVLRRASTRLLAARDLANRQSAT